MGLAVAVTETTTRNKYALGQNVFVVFRFYRRTVTEGVNNVIIELPSKPMRVPIAQLNILKQNRCEGVWTSRRHSPGDSTRTSRYGYVAPRKR